MSKLLKEFQDYLTKINQYEHVVTLLYWDMKTGAPKLGQEGHVTALTHFSTESFSMSTSEKMGEMLTGLTEPEEFEALTDTWRFIIREMKRDYDRNKRIPADVYMTFVQTQAQAGNVWMEAKEKSDYSLFAPYLQKMIDLTIEMAGYTDPDKEVYDALLDQYEAGMDSATIDRLFENLKKELIPFVKKILSQDKQTASAGSASQTHEHGISSCTTGANEKNPAFRSYFDPDGQRKVQEMLLDYIGFCKDAGSVGESEHPFTLNFSSKDVRLTNHYYENDPLSAIFSAIHEGGHAIFEQNVNPEYDNTVAGSCRYMGLHESQSRFYENILGRNKNFWLPIYDKLGELLPPFKEIPLEDFYQEINHVKNSFIRVNADEVTYCFHIILRYEMEKAIFRDHVSVNDLPALWNEKMQEYLQITPTNDAEGILQDMHWSDGGFGYFPSYLLGSIYDGMLLDTLQEELGNVDGLLKNGQIKEITAWLNQKIHWYGSTCKPRDAIRSVCGKEISVEPLLRYFKEKYTEIYRI